MLTTCNNLFYNQILQSMLNETRRLSLYIRQLIKGDHSVQQQAATLTLFDYSIRDLTAEKVSIYFSQY